MALLCLALVVAVPARGQAQQPFPPPYPSPPYPQYPQYPGQPGYPQPAQSSPGPGSPQQPGPMPKAEQPAAQPPSPGAPAPGSLTLTTPSEEARALLVSCIEALDNFHPDLARARCGEAVARDPQLALAHAFLAEAQTGAEAIKKSLDDAADALQKREASEGERLLVAALSALRGSRLGEARRALDRLVQIAGADRRPYLYRGRLRQRTADLDGALADYRKAAEIDPKYGPSWNSVGYALMNQGKLDEAATAFMKYVEHSPREPNAHDSLAQLRLRQGDVAAAMEAARRAIDLDSKFLPAHWKLGDALLFSGKGQQARKAYAVLEAAADPALRHEGAMRSARSYLFEGAGLQSTLVMTNVERALMSEAETAHKAGREFERAQALIELCRLHVERNALSEAARVMRTLREIVELREASLKSGVLTEPQRQRIQIEMLVLRALILAGVGERALAEARVEELEQLVKGPPGTQLAQELRGDVLARSGEAESAALLLEKATRPTMRLALALSLAASREKDDPARARAVAIMEELSRRTVNDLEGALTRLRAKAWLKANAPAGQPESKS